MAAAPLATPPDDDDADAAPPSDGGQPDSIPSPMQKAPPDVKDDLDTCFAHVDELRAHHDPVEATDYLKALVNNAKLLPQDHSRAMIELADVLQDRGEVAESLCWLKMWTELFPSRPEYAAVAYRLAALYSRMDMPDLARDAYYLSLAHAVNQGQVHTGNDLDAYNRLTTATLWGLAANEYEAGDWERAAELFDRYAHEATAATPLSLEKAAYLRADCLYQSRRTADAIKLYDDTLTKHPFNPLAPQARLRLYHLYVASNQPVKAQAELQALIWTVRTVWPKDEAYWQHQTAQMLLAINGKNFAVLPPLVKESALLPPEGKSWQETIKHYDALVSYQVVKTQGNAGQAGNALAASVDPNCVDEEKSLLVMNYRLNQLLPPPEENHSR
jgi:tetratricopeptide (TPR) repeat protein